MTKKSNRKPVRSHLRRMIAELLEAKFLLSSDLVESFDNMIPAEVGVSLRPAYSQSSISDKVTYQRAEGEFYPNFISECHYYDVNGDEAFGSGGPENLQYGVCSSYSEPLAGLGWPVYTTSPSGAVGPVEPTGPTVPNGPTFVYPSGPTNGAVAFWWGPAGDIACNVGDTAVRRSASGQQAVPINVTFVFGEVTYCQGGRPWFVSYINGGSNLGFFDESELLVTTSRSSYHFPSDTTDWELLVNNGTSTTVLPISSIVMSGGGFDSELALVTTNLTFPDMTPEDQDGTKFPLPIRAELRIPETIDGAESVHRFHATTDVTVHNAPFYFVSAGILPVIRQRETTEFLVGEFRNDNYLNETTTVTQRSDLRTEVGLNGAVRVYATVHPTELYWNNDIHFVGTEPDGATAEVSIHYRVMNAPPIAVDDDYRLGHNATLKVESSRGVTQNDIDGMYEKPLRAVVVQPPLHGMLDMNVDGGFTYTPNPGFAGQDAFAYSASDGDLWSLPATVTLTVSNAIPVAVDDINVIVPHSRKSNLTIKSNDTDADGDLTQVVVTTEPTHGLVVPKSDGTVSFIADAGYFGPDSFAYKLWDGIAFSNVASVSMQIINTTPTATDEMFSMSHDRSLTKTPLLTDSDGDPLQFRLKSLPANGIIDLKGQSWTYTPSIHFVGSDSFTYALYDGIIESPTSTISIDTVNHAPVAMPFALKVRRNNTVEQQLSSRTSDADDDSLLVEVKTQPTDGRVTIHENGQILYERWSEDLNPNWTDSFTYTFFDGLLESNEATVSLALTNAVPSPSADNYRIDNATNLFKNVLVNDYDVDGDTLRVAVRPGTGPAHAKTFRLDADGTLVYVPQDNFHGVDTFTYNAYDAWPTPGTGTVSIRVENLPPVTYARTFDVIMDDTLTIPSFWLATDSPEDTLIFRALSDVQHGLLSMDSNGQTVYVPNPGFTGADLFRFTVSDGRNTSPSTTIKINVNLPVPSAYDRSFYVRPDETTSSLQFSLLNNAYDGYASGELAMTASIFGTPTHGIAVINTDGTFSFTPNPGYFGNASFQFRSFNGFSYSSPVTIGFQVGPMVNNDYLGFYGSTEWSYAILRSSVGGNNRNYVTQFSSNYYFPTLDDWSGLAYQLVQPPIHAATTLVLNADGSFVYTPIASYQGRDSFQYRVVRISDGQVVSRVTTASINVPAVSARTNNPPTLSGFQLHVQTNGATTTSLKATDVDNDPLTFEFSSNPRVTDNRNGTVTYRAAQGFVGLDGVRVRAFDGMAYSAWEQVVFEVSNQAPSLTSPTLSVHHRKTLIINLSEFATDSDRDSLTLSILTQPSVGTLASRGPGVFVFTPLPGHVESTFITYTASDGLASSTGTITINVTNTPPKTNWKKTDVPDQIDEYWISPGGTIDANSGVGYARVVSGPQTGRLLSFDEKVYTGGIDLLTYLQRGSPKEFTELTRRLSNSKSKSRLISNDFDLDADPLRAELVQGVDFGYLQLSNDGSFLYEPDPLHPGLQSFTYRITDGAEWSPPTAVLIHVQNDPPTSNSFSVTTGRHGTIRTKSDDSPFSMPGNSRDLENNKLTYSLVASPTKGTATVNSDGSFEYKNTDGVLGNDAFTYRSFDGTNYSQPATISIAIKNDRPAARSDSYDAVRNFNEGGLFDAVYSVIGNLPATDPDKDPLSLDFQSGPFHGTFTVDADGQFVYKPTAGYLGNDTVVYRVTDGPKSSEYAKLTFKSKQSAPRAVDDAFSASGFIGDVLNIGFDRSILRNDTDSEDQALRAILWKPLSTGQGTVSLNSDGSFQYDPQGFHGNVEFSYIVTDGATKSQPAKVKINVQPAKFAAQTSPFSVDVDQEYQGALAGFDYIDSTDLSVGSVVQILTTNNQIIASGTIRSTNFSTGQRQWEIVPINLTFSIAGKQLLNLSIKDSRGRFSSAEVELFVKATPPKLMLDQGLSLPRGLDVGVNIGTFRDSRNYTPASYKVKLNWGDGTISDGAVRRLSPGNFHILGTPPYSTMGDKTVQVEMVTQNGEFSSATASISVVQQLVLDEIDSVASTATSVSQSGKLASFQSNVPATLISQLIAKVFWGDGATSLASIVSTSQGRYELRSSHTYAASGQHRIAIAIADPSGAIESYTANPSNPAVGWFTQDLAALTFESSQRRNVVHFYGNQRSEPSTKFGVGINWNDTRSSLNRNDLVSNGGWYQVRESLGYAAGTFQPSVEIRRTLGTATNTESSLSLDVSVASITFVPISRIVAADSDFASKVARFTSSLSTSRASDFESDVLWSDGVRSTGTIQLVNGVFEVTTKRAFKGDPVTLTSTIRVHSPGLTSSSSSTSSTSSSRGQGEGEQSPSSTGTTSQVVRGTPSVGYMPIRDVSSSGCPNEFKLFIDNENYEVDSDDDDKDEVKVRQIFGGKFGRFVQINSGDQNRNGIVDYNDNIAGVTQLVGNTVALTMTFSNPQNNSAEFGLGGWNESEIRIWKKIPAQSLYLATYEMLHPGSYFATQLGIPETGGSTTFYLEGMSESVQLGDKSITGTFGGLRATVKITVGGTDLLVDGMKEVFEDSLQDPGAVIIKNSNFTKKDPTKTGQTEAGTIKFLPDYLVRDNQIIDPNFAQEFTKATISVSNWMVQAADIKLSFDDSKISLWTYDNWTGVTSGSDGVFTIKPETRLRPKTNKLSFWIEGIDETTINGMYIIVTAIDREDGRPLGDDKSRFIVTDLNIGVDGNRDGKIEFDNNFDQQLTFWLNNDQEGRLTDPQSEEIDVLNNLITKPDNTDNKILSKRDLEDFAPVNFKVSPVLRYFTTLSSTKIEFEGELRDDSNSKLHFFKSASTSDNPLAHVQNSASADMQLVEQSDEKFRIANSSQKIDLDFTGQTNGVLRYLFEAWGNIARGDATASLKPTLIFRVKVTYPGGNVITREREVKLDLRDITAFYTRREIPYLANGIDIRKNLGFPHFGDSIETGKSTVLQTPFLSGDDTLVVLHGWEMAPEWKAVFAKTAVKRLYWEGYRGEFVAFDWPTFNNREAPRMVGFPESMANTYNASEFQALRSGRALKHFLQTLRQEKTHLIAHSMGNVVAAEALRQWSRSSAVPLVKNYVALQAAISAGAYGASVGTGVPSALDVILPNSLGGFDLSDEASRIIGESLPDLYSNFQGTPYMSGTRSAASPQSSEP